MTALGNILGFIIGMFATSLWFYVDSFYRNFISQMQKNMLLFNYKINVFDLPTVKLVDMCVMQLHTYFFAQK